MSSTETDAALVAQVAALDRDLATRVGARLKQLRLRAVVVQAQAHEPGQAQGKIGVAGSWRLALARLWRRP